MQRHLETTSIDIAASQDSTRPADHWLRVTENLIAARMSQYKELGNSDADSPDFFKPQLEILDLLRTKLAENDAHTAQLLDDMESQTIEASGGNSQASYFLAHVKQLDVLAGMVEPPQDS